MRPLKVNRAPALTGGFFRSRSTRLIAKGDKDGLPLAEGAINEYWDLTPTHARKSGLRFLQQDVLTQRNALLGDHRNFADTVNAYIEKKLAE
jgi:hypothetical protein